MNKRLIMTSFALVALSVPAGAADLPAQTPSAAPSLAGAESWGGFYGGLGLGLGRSNSRTSYAHTQNPNGCSNNSYGSAGGCTGDINYSSIFNGASTQPSLSVRLGYNWQTENVVYGFVGTLNLEKKQTYSDDVSVGLVPDALGVKQSFRNLGSAKVLLGYSLGSFLPYGVVGISAARVSTSISQVALGYTGVEFKKKETQYGWVVGGGGKFQVNPHFVVGVEYLYTRYRSLDLSGANSTCCGGIMYPDTTAATRASSNAIKLITEYKF